ncbi:hypothetical protein FGB62_25g634 [Gracilaria domingensis]|nr:hypothetical protein FGB62_25g634 [Gracilaria domingensis]
MHTRPVLRHLRPWLPAADVPNRGICRPVGSSPLTARDDSSAPMLPAECQGDLTNSARRQCCVESDVRCLRRGELCSTAGSRIAPIPCAEGLVCRIFDEGFPAVDRPNRGVCVPS